MKTKRGKLSLDLKVWLSLLQLSFSWKWTNSTTLNLLPNIDIFNLFILKLFLKLSNLLKFSHHYDLSLTFMFHTKIKNTFFCWQTWASKKWEMKPKTFLSNFFSFFLIFLQNTQGEAALTRPVLTRQMLAAQYRVHINTQSISFNCMRHVISRLCCNMAVECLCVSLFVLVARLPESVSAPAVKTKTMMHDNLQVHLRRQARQVKSAWQFVCIASVDSLIRAHVELEVSDLAAVVKMDGEKVSVFFYVCFFLVYSSYPRSIWHYFLCNIRLK